MYLEHWGLKKAPFGNVPSAEIFFRSPQHEEALRRLMYAIEYRKGVAMLTGEVGCGKTTVTKALKNHLDKDVFQLRTISNPALQPTDLIKAILLKLGDNSDNGNGSKTVLLYSVDVYWQAHLRLGAGNTVTGFNRVGLNASSGGLIRTMDDITVTGIVDTSTESYIPAVSAVRNAIIHIRNGGTFTAGSTTRTVDDNGFTIYPAAVWAGDNATLIVDDATNPTVFNGAVESGYSAMIRLRGSTIHGVLGVYHSSVVHMTNTTQDLGEVWVGDGGYLRVESSTLTPADTDGFVESISLYRSGRARINNSTLNLGGINITAFGFTVLNLRGTTNLGTDGVNCGSGSNVSIQSSVTLGTVSCLP